MKQDKCFIRLGEEGFQVCTKWKFTRDHKRGDSHNMHNDPTTRKVPYLSCSYTCWLNSFEIKNFARTPRVQKLLDIAVWTVQGAVRRQVIISLRQNNVRFVWSRVFWLLPHPLFYGWHALHLRGAAKYFECIGLNMDDRWSAAKKKKPWG